MADELFENKPEKVNLDVDYIVSIIQEILDKSHIDSRKKIIKFRPNENNIREININCPICGDGKSVKFRGHLFLKNFWYVCYNERDTDSMSFTKFCEKFNVQLDPEKKLQIYNYINQNISFTTREDFALESLDKLLDAKEYMDFLNNKKGSFLTNITTIKKDSMVFDYLKKRQITNYSNILQGLYHITIKWVIPVIIILNRCGNKLLGFQVRNLKEGDLRFYKEHEFGYLYNYKNTDNPLDELESIAYNKLSHLFNILNLDFNKPINAFEGYLDSVFFPNSMSLLGLDTDINLIENDSLDLKFIFDNDEPGIRKAKKMLEQEKSVFLWRKLFDDLAKGDFVYHNYLEENIKDINQLVILLDNPNIYYDLKLDNYFSKDKFDMIYLKDKPKKKRNKKTDPLSSSEWDGIKL